MSPLKLTTQSSNQREFENPKPDNHPAICYSVIDMGSSQNRFGKMVPKVRLMFELPFSKTKEDKPHIVLSTYPAYLSTKANLRKDLESWRGKPFSSTEAETFDMSKLLGAKCMINLQPSEDGGTVWIKGITPIPNLNGKPMVDMPAKTFNELRFLELSFERFDAKVFDALSDKTRAQIAETPEFKALFPSGLWQKGSPAPAPRNAQGEPALPPSDVNGTADDDFPPF